MFRREQPESGAIEPRRRSQPAGIETPAVFNPFGLFRRLADDMDRMFEGTGFPTFGRVRSEEAGIFAPKVDLFKKDGKLIVRADLPGVKLDDVSVEITDNAVVIEGERSYEHEEDERGVYRLERSYGRFYREVPLPEGVKAESASATFKNGVLEIAIEAPESEQRRRIEVKGEGEPQPTAKAPSEGEQKSPKVA
jgi:HSP20 family protein